MSRSRSRLLLVGLVGAVLAASVIGTSQAHDNDPAAAYSASLRTPRGDVGAGRWVLVYGPTLAQKPINERKVALRLGFRVKVATKDEWSAMTEDQFSNFSTIVFGDPFCEGGTGRFDAAIANQATWSAAVDGNVVVGTFDAVWHANAGIGKHGPPERLIANSLRFTGLGEGTGLDVSLSCYDTEGLGTPVELLAGIGDFSAISHGGNCDNILVPDPDHPLLRRLSAEQLSHWRCSTHAALDGVPAGFDTVATKRTGVPVLVAHTAT